ncbi:MAG TPA: BolA family protein [Gammaproteobacteria bacterium]|nr:BolA family protein [Gammaproteobacteria bacterium]
MNRVERIEEQLQEAFAPTELVVRDDSHKHIGHPGAQSGLGHFHVHIISERFRGVPLLERHRLIYAALNDMMKTDIHALSLNATAPDTVITPKSEHP